MIEKRGMRSDLEIRAGFDNGRTRLERPGRREGGGLKGLESEKEEANRDGFNAAAISRSSAAV